MSNSNLQLAVYVDIKQDFHMLFLMQEISLTVILSHLKMSLWYAPNSVRKRKRFGRKEEVAKPTIFLPSPVYTRGFKVLI